jgi:hypothetical protein
MHECKAGVKCPRESESQAATRKYTAAHSLNNDIIAVRGLISLA